MNGFNNFNEMFRRINERAGREKDREELLSRKKPEQIMAEALLRGEQFSTMIVQTTLFKELINLEKLVSSLEQELKGRNDRLEKIIADLHDRLGEVNKENTLLRAESAEMSEKLQDRRVEIYHLKEELAVAKNSIKNAEEEILDLTDEISVSKEEVSPSAGEVTEVK